jgi:major type 1 subunit fimbrin (pilin)
MNKTLLSAALIAGLGVAAFAPQAANAAPNSGGTITITGAIAASTCSVAVAGSASPTIVLPTTMTNALATAGASSGWTASNIVLTGCTVIAPYTTVVPFFSGANIDTTTGYLKNTGTATNVQVALSSTQSLTGALTLQGLSGAQGLAPTPLATGGTTTYTLYAGYVAQGASTAGSVSTSVIYALNYQ